MSFSISSLSSQIASNMLSKIDTKNQGYIDKTELSTAYSSVDTSNADSSDDMFSHLDSDGDGKVTKSELTTGIENLLSKLNSSSVQGQGDGNQPPPGDDQAQTEGTHGKHHHTENDTGLTKDQMTKMASDSKDSKFSSMLKDVSANFDSADTNKDGKVTREEAMAYEKSKNASSSQSDNTSPSNPGSDNNVSSNNNGDAVLNKIAELLQKYGVDTNSSPSFSTDSSASGSSSSISTTA